MSWIKKIFGSSKVVATSPSSREDVIAQLDRIANEVRGEVDVQISPMLNAMDSLETNPLMKESEVESALESVYWASILLRLIEKAEQGWVPQEWVAQLLNDILNEMESEKRGCKVRFARQMLQEYAEMNQSEPAKMYFLETKLNYFYSWLWECLKAKDALKPSQDKLVCFKPVLEPFVKKEVWN